MSRGFIERVRVSINLAWGLRGEWRQDAELVAFGVGQHRPSHIVTLADLRRPSPQTYQTIHRGRLVRGAQIEMKPVLCRLVIGDLDEQEVGGHVNFHTAVGWFDDRLVIVLVSDPPAQRFGPEASERRAVVRVDDKTLNAYAHGATIAARLQWWLQATPRVVSLNP